MSEAPVTPPPPAPETPSGPSKEERQWNMFIHLSLLSGFVIPLGGLLVPIILWQLKKDEFPSSNAHGYVVVNWLLSALIYGIVCFILTFIVIGILGYIALAIVAVVFPIIGGIKANDGELWEYPLSIRFFS